MVETALLSENVEDKKPEERDERQLMQILTERSEQKMRKGISLAFAKRHFCESCALWLLK